MTTREIDERIANVLRLLAKHWRDGHPAYVLGLVAAKMRAAQPTKTMCQECLVDHPGHMLGCSRRSRAAEPASEPAPQCVEAGCVKKAGHDGYHWNIDESYRWTTEPTPAPPPSLVERAKNWGVWGRDPAADMLIDELADALEAAQADLRRLDALRVAHNLLCKQIRLLPGAFDDPA